MKLTEEGLEASSLTAVEMRRGATAGRAQTGLSTVDTIAADVGITKIARQHDMPADTSLALELGVHRWFIFHVPEDADVPAVAERLADDPNVEHALPDWRLDPALVPDDPYYSDNWGHNNTAQLLSYDWDTHSHENGDPVGTVGFDCNAPTAAGTVYVRVTDTNRSWGANGLDSVYVDEVCVESDAQPQPPAADFVGDPTSGYAPLAVRFTDTSTGNPTSWSWDFGDGVGTSTEQNPLYTYTAVGKYTVTLIATNVQGSDTETKIDYVDVQEQPDNSVSVSDIEVSRTYDGRFYRGQALATVVDKYGAPMAGATVSGTFNAPNTKVKSGTTDGSGVATVTSDKTKSPPADWCFTVTDVTLSGYVHDPEANAVTTACESGWQGARPGLPEVHADGPGLRANRLNPFRDLTEVVFVLPTETHIRLEIYNVAGRRVALLTDGVVTAGAHSVRWDAAGHPSGLYFCRLTREGIVESKAMVLVK